jgi:hypothetical protein
MLAGQPQAIYCLPFNKPVLEEKGMQIFLNRQAYDICQICKKKKKRKKKSVPTS